MVAVVNHCGLYEKISHAGLADDRDAFTRRVLTRTGERLETIGSGRWPKATKGADAGVDLVAAHCAEKVVEVKTQRALAALDLDDDTHTAVIIPDARTLSSELFDGGRNRVDVMELALVCSGEVMQIILGSSRTMSEPYPPSIMVMGWTLAPSAIEAGARRLADDMRMSLNDIVIAACREFQLTSIGDLIGTTGKDAFRAQVLEHAQWLFDEMTRSGRRGRKKRHSGVASEVAQLAHAAVKRSGRAATDTLTRDAGTSTRDLDEIARRQHISSC